VIALLRLPRDLTVRLVKGGLQQLDLGNAAIRIIVFGRYQKVDAGLHGLAGRRHHLPERTIEQTLGGIVAQADQLVARLRIECIEALELAQALVVAPSRAIGSDEDLVGRRNQITSDLIARDNARITVIAERELATFAHIERDRKSTRLNS